MPRKIKTETVAQLAKKKLDAMWERAMQMQMPKKDNPQEIMLEPPKANKLTPDHQKKKNMRTTTTWRTAKNAWNEQRNGNANTAKSRTRPQTITTTGIQNGSTKWPTIN